MEDSKKSKFITNEERVLADVLKNIIPSTASLDFLVGYFYFSGFAEIYEQIKSQHIKVLVGLEVERNLRNSIVELNELATKEINLSDEGIINNFFKGLKTVTNETNIIDSKKAVAAFKVFAQKIKDGSLEIRKTRDPNHAKLYVFTNSKEFNCNGELLGTVITGSSNLSISGLKNRDEIDVILKDNHDFVDAKTIFESLWDHSIPITTGGDTDPVIKLLLDETWLGSLETPPTPYLIYLRVLDEYFGSKNDIEIKYPAEISNERFTNLDYQIDAIKKAIETVKENGGVLISDVVGLGKSIVASSIIYNLGRFERAIIICRPHLVEDWEDYADIFNLNAHVFSSGDMTKALEWDRACVHKNTIIVIDEVHQFRNAQTEDYGRLHQICQDKKVILTTATPFNNRPNDVFNLIKLFQIPKKSTIELGGLSRKFQKLEEEHKTIRKKQREGTATSDEINNLAKILADKMRDLISPVVIRRSRKDLLTIEKYRKDLEKNGFEIAEVEPPKDVDYDLKELSDKYIETLEKIYSREEKISGFLGTRYKPTSHLKKDKIAELMKEFKDEEEFNLLVGRQKNLAIFMRRLLVSRFESSIAAFHETLNNIIGSMELTMRWIDTVKGVPIYKKGQIPDPDDFDVSSEELDTYTKENLNDFEEAVSALKEKGLKVISIDYLDEDFFINLKKDYELLKGIRQEWSDIGKDYKLDKLRSQIQEKLKENPNRKIIIFTQYADTANYLGEKLKEEKNFRTIFHTAALANKKTRKIIKENFDAGLPEKSQKNDYDVLVSTDTLSEGVNLHRAGIIINYDIPYNPMRVVQRVGRINRINKKVFDKLYIYNYFPSEIGEEEINVRGISTLKIMLTNHIFGTDVKVLTDKEEIKSFYEESFRTELNKQDELSWDSAYFNFYNELKSKAPQDLVSARRLPLRTRIQVKDEENSGVVVFCRKGINYLFKFGKSPEEIADLSDREGIEIFEKNQKAEFSPVSEKFYEIYEPLKSQLFIVKSETVATTGKTRALAKIDALLRLLPQEVIYLRKLKETISDCDNLPATYLMKINRISEKSLQKDFVDLKKSVPEEYLDSIINKGKSIEKGEEMIILSEELNPGK